MVHQGSTGVVVGFSLLLISLHTYQRDWRQLSGSGPNYKTLIQKNTKKKNGTEEQELTGGPTHHNNRSTLDELTLWWMICNMMRAVDDVGRAQQRLDTRPPGRHHRRREPRDRVEMVLERDVVDIVSMEGG